MISDLVTLGILALPFIIALAWVWIKQFVWMMALDESSFPGKNDKIIWGASFIILPLFAPFAFIMWKSAWKEYQKAEREENKAKVEMKGVTDRS
jgi:hypothetical protein